MEHRTSYREKKNILFDAMKTRYSIDVEEKRMINQQVSWRHDAFA